MNNNIGCGTMVFFTWPAMAYWVTTVSVFVDLLQEGAVWYNALGWSILWPLVLVDRVITSAIVIP